MCVGGGGDKGQRSTSAVLAQQLDTLFSETVSPSLAPEVQQLDYAG